MEEDYRAQLAGLLDAYGIGLSAVQQDLLVRHLRLVVERNRTLNLTRIDGMHDGLVLHVLDSLLGLRVLSAAEIPSQPKLVDVGSGAGFPGIPLCIATGWDTLLIDSVGKKVSACQEFVDSLRIADRVRCEHVRVEELSRESPARFDLVTMRALSRLAVLLEYASPLLPTGGLLLAYKGRPSDEELEQAHMVEGVVGMSLVSRETFQLPEQYGQRELLLYRKEHAPRVRLPRRPGEATRTSLV